MCGLKFKFYQFYCNVSSFYEKFKMILQMNIVAEQWEIKEKKSKILVNPSHL